MNRPAFLAALAAVCIAFPTIAGAAIGEAPTECITIASDQRAIRDAGALIKITLFQGIEARHFLSVLVELGAPESDTWGKAQAIMLMVGAPGADPPALLKFFDASGCAYYALATDLHGVAVLLAKLGEGA